MAGGAFDGVVWQVRVEPSDGGGYLTEHDVMSACVGLPDGGAVELVLSEFDNFSPPAVGVLARRLADVEVTFTVSASARSTASGFVEMFRRAQEHYLAVEAERLQGRSA